MHTVISCPGPGVATVSNTITPYAHATSMFSPAFSGLAHFPECGPSSGHPPGGSVKEADLLPPVWFDNTVLAIQAVLQGLGVGVLPLEPVCTGHYACAYALRPGRDTAHVRVLTDWLIRSGKETTPH